jgi:phosphoribosylanthranilate isomerase
MWVKVCGVTRIEDAEAAVAANVDAIGLVFAESPRRVSISQAMQLAAAVGWRVPLVGVFVNADAEEVLAIHQQVPLFAAQFHGAWTAATLGSIAAAGIRPIPALRFGADHPALAAAAQTAIQAGAREILLDAAVPGKMGGTGVTFDWGAARLWSAQFSDSVRWVAAGGLTPENVGAAITALRPWGVDVSSGVEEAPGVKSHAKIRALVQAARLAATAMAQEKEGVQG